MEATRMRLGSVIEWVFAAVLFVLAAGAGSVALREFHTVTAVIPVMPVSMPVSAHEPQAAAPAGVPSRAVSVPLLHLADGHALKVGDTAQQAAAAIGQQAAVSGETIERTPQGERIIRAYDSHDARFVLVVEAGRIAGIYVQ